MREIFNSIRCPNDRKHADYCLCGRLLGLIKDGKIYLYCEMCKQFYEITIKENDTVEMTIVSKNKRLSLISNLKLVQE